MTAPAHRRRDYVRRLIWLAEVDQVTEELERRGAVQLADELRRIREQKVRTRYAPTAFAYRPSRRHAEVLRQTLAMVRA